MFRLNKTFILTLTGVIFGFLAGQVWDRPYKEIVKFFHVDQYGYHVFQCDNAMREHFLAKSKVSFLPNAETTNALQSAELGLIDCHYYDKFRKKLIDWGLNANDLSAMGLKAIENKRTDLSKLVKEHEIRY